MLRTIRGSILFMWPNVCVYKPYPADGDIVAQEAQGLRVNVVPTVSSLES